MKKIISISVVMVVLDQIIKYFIATLELHYKFTIIPNFFNITYVQNDGAAWNILSGNSWLLALVGIATLFLFYFFLIKNQKLSSFNKISYGLLIGGIVGNLFDRLFRGYVIDYLSFKIFGYYFPIFNLADILIVIGMGLIIVEMLKGGHDGKNSCN